MSRNQPGQLDAYQAKRGLRPIAWRVAGAPSRASYRRARSKYPLPVAPSLQSKANARRLRQRAA